MIVSNPQWQGAGMTDELRAGAETLKHYFSDLAITEIPLSTKDLAMVDNIKCFHPIVEQAVFFRDIIAAKHPTKISTLGGDCGIEIIPISYLNKIYAGNLCIVWIDAHADLNTPDSSPSKTFHGMPLRTLLGEGHNKLHDLLFSQINPAQVCFVGLRDVDEAEATYITNNAMTMLPDCEFSAIKAKINTVRNVYVHLDLDVLDRSVFAFTLFPTRNGLQVKDVATLLKNLKADYNVVGFCVTESTATTIAQLHPIRPILNHIEL